MSINDTIGQVAATNPVVGVAVNTAQVNAAILMSLQLGDPSASSLLGAQSAQAQEANQLLSQLVPNLGQNVNAAA